MSRYDWYKSHGICPRCGQADAVKDKVYCLNCLDKEAVSTMMYRVTHDTKEKNRMFCKTRYYMAKENGICVRCFKRKARQGKAICQICFNKVHEKQAIYQRLKRKGENEK
jgi:hypothetical protein